MQRFIHVTFESVTFRSTNFSKVLVKHIVQWGKIHLCHNYLFLKRKSYEETRKNAIFVALIPGSL